MIYRKLTLANSLESSTNTSTCIPWTVTSVKIASCACYHVSIYTCRPLINTKTQRANAMPMLHTLPTSKWRASKRKYASSSSLEFSKSWIARIYKKLISGELCHSLIDMNFTHTHIQQLIPLSHTHAHKRKEVQVSTGWDERGGYHICITQEKKVWEIRREGACFGSFAHLQSTFVKRRCLDACRCDRVYVHLTAFCFLFCAYI